MPQNAAHTSRWAIAEVVFGSALLGALVLHWLVPLSLPRGRFAFVFGVAGVSLIALAFRLKGANDRREQVRQARA